jgi:hypothetical protein
MRVKDLFSPTQKILADEQLDGNQSKRPFGRPR